MIFVFYQLMEKIFNMPQPPDESYFGLWLKLKVFILSTGEEKCPNCFGILEAFLYTYCY